MATVQVFENAPIGENTYIVYDESGECVIIDPGMYSATDQNAVINFIRDNNLRPVRLLNTHCHYDHVLSNKFIFDQYGLKPEFHEGEADLLAAVPSYIGQMGLRYELSPMPEKYLPESGIITFGYTAFELIFAPGHSPAHLCFYSKADGFVIGGDVLFRGSIGRTDLPGGNYTQLISNIREKLFTLPDNTVVYPGHGTETTIGFEKQHNPFF